MKASSRSNHHHLAKHSLASEVDVELHFGSTDPKEVAREIARLGQKQLQVCSYCWLMHRLRLSLVTLPT